MKITRLSCQGCGAPLEASASFVTCSYCRIQAEIVPDRIQARAIEILDAQNQRLEMELAEHHLREDLRRLDSVWLEVQKRYLIADGGGGWMDPCVFRVGTGLFVAGLGFLFTWRAAGQGSLFWLPAALMAIIGVRVVSGSWLRHNEFDRLRGSYLARRSGLVARIREASRLRRITI